MLRLTVIIWILAVLSARSFRADSQEHGTALSHSVSHEIETIAANETGDIDKAIKNANVAYRQILLRAKQIITLYAMTNNGECPSSVPLGLETGYSYGLGCKFPDACHCPKSPFSVCYTRGLFSQPNILTSNVIETFGYCRTGLWVFICGGLVVVAVIGLVIYFVKKR
ncbi:unnamed protein product [Cladocopium goreaui]|uniref:Uncharacterized protein n=1 Tax=Cladocopium goreaui TaxID=2562237 RepID=A0A9P1G191_9DINO|nr:unnamed protein product [Cladocopium goreaui]